MMEFIAQNVLFVSVLIAVMFVPGVVLMRFVDKKKIFDPVETLFVAFVLSLTVALFSGIVMDVLHIPITLFSLGAEYVVWMILFVWFVRKTIDNSKEFLISRNKKSYSVAFAVIFGIAILLKSVFLFQNPVPISTDLGHHMYWSKTIVETGVLPQYEEREILMAQSDGDKHAISDPEPISDVIVGEHILFATVALLTGTSLISVYPLVVLFMIHSITMLGVYLLARRLFSGLPLCEVISVMALFGFGILFGLDSPQMKYVSGGVVGNIFGFLFIVGTVLTFLVALMKRSAGLLSLGIVFSFTLAYTHHLSTLLFALSLAGILVFLFFTERKFMVREVLPLLWDFRVLGTLGVGLVMFFLVWTPSYITNNAVQTVVGSPVEKEEHMGMTLEEYAGAVGEDRMYFGFFSIGFLMFLFWWRRYHLMRSKKDASASPFFVGSVLVGWSLPLLVLVFFPSVVGIDIPSGRVANYTIIPFVLLWALCVVGIFSLMKRENAHKKVFMTGFVVLFFLGFSLEGWLDNFSLLNAGTSMVKGMELHRLASYLGEWYEEKDEVVLYDHININGGSWMKLYFMRDYNYPMYRAHLFRYDRASDKTETCTLSAISTPESAEAKKCYQDLSVSAIAINEALDGKPFRENEDFSRVYAGKNYAIYGYFGNEK